MTSIQDLEQRVTTVEGELIDVREEVAEVRTLAAGASQDAADHQSALRGHKASLEALRVTQLEQSVILRKLAETQEAHFVELGITQLDQSNRLQVLSKQVKAVSDEVGKVRRTQLEQHAQLDSLTGDVTALKGDVAGLKDDVTELKGDVAALKSDVAELKGDVAELKGTVAGMTQGMDRIARAVESLVGGAK